MPYRRRPGAYAALDLQIKPRTNPRKYILPVADGKDRVGFGCSSERFQPEDYYLENGEPGANSLLNPGVGRSPARDSQAFNDSAAHMAGEEKPSIRGWASPDDAIKPKRGWCGGAHFSSFAPKAGSPLLEKGADLMQLSGNETRLHELQALRDRKLHQPPGPGSYELQGDIKPRSYRRPESGGPKSPIHGKSIREVERERYWQAIQARVVSPGPGYYDTARAKDRTQTRKAKQPVGANFKTAYTRKAECLSVTMLTGHHWREHVPPLGQVATARPPSDHDYAHESDWAPSLRSPERAQQLKTSNKAPKEHQKLQALLDARLSQPKLPSPTPYLSPRVEPPQALLRMPETRSSSPAAWHWGATEPGSKSAFALGTARDHSRTGHYEDVARAPSAPPLDNAGTYETESILRAEASDSFAPIAYQGQRPGADLGRPLQSEAARAAQTALRQEQRRMEWQIRSSHGVRLESSASSLYAVPIQWADYKVRASHH